MKRSTFSNGEAGTKRIFLIAVMLITAFCLAFTLMPSFSVQAEGIGGTAFSSDYDSQEEAYDAANLFNEQLVEEGIVLLKNDGNALPLSSGAKINVLGKNSANIAIGGTGSSTGSGSIEAPKAVSLYESLGDAGFELNPDLMAFYEDNELSGVGRPSPSMGQYLNWLSTGETPPESYTPELKATYADYDDASIVVITRIGGEGYDLPLTMISGSEPAAGSLAGDHYLELDLYEKAIFASLEADASVSKVIVIVNASQQMELGFLNDSTNYSKVKAAIWVGGPGQSGVAAIGRVLNGEVNPSGHLVDTFAADFTKDPVWFNFGNSGSKGSYGTIAINEETQEEVFTGGRGNYVDYEEGIYLGYRYWETAGFEKDDNWAWYDENVVYPLGYGLSYTSFSWEMVGSPVIPSPLTIDSNIEVTVKVTNTGSVAGKDVVQLYYTAPYYDGGIEKSYVRLADFAKSPLLAAGASANVTMSVAVKDLASYDYSDANQNGFKGYELEAGNYTFRVLKNANARSTNGVADFTVNVPVAATNGATNGATGLKFTHDEVTGTLIQNLFDDVSQKALNGRLEDKTVDAVKDTGGFMNVMTRATAQGGLAGTIPTDYPDNARRTVSQVFLDSYKTPSSTAARIAADEGKPWYMEEFPTQAENELGEVTIFLKDLMGKASDDPLWDDFMDQMTYKEMASLIGHGSFHTTPIERLGKPWSIEVDGPVGLVPRQSGGELEYLNNYVCCVYATQPVVAATWNKELVHEYGNMTGEESIWGNTDFALSGIYAPGLNIHRSPFSGRNFEYYSEDGVLASKMAAEFCGGAFEKGLYTMMKHYVLNDQETNRSGVHTWADEQTMREIYFLPYEKAIKDGNSRGAMAAYNSIGTTWTGNSYALMIDLTRNEWGFEGMIITDWAGYNANTHSWMVRTGTDLVLGGSGEGTLPYEGDDLTPTYAWALRRAAKAIMFTVGNSNAMIPRLSYADVNANPADFRGTVPYTMDVSGAKPNYELDEPLDVTYSAVNLPTQLILDPATGIITGTLPKADPSNWWAPVPESYTFTITATVPTGSTINTSVSQEFTIKQAALSPITMLSSGRVGIPYYNDALQYSLSVPYDPTEITFKLDPGLKYGSWVIRPASPALPAGLVLNSNGTITGTPTVATEEPIEVIIIVSALGVTDASLTRSISVLPASPAISFVNVTLDAGEVASEYNATLVATGADAITFASDNLPAGLSLDPSGAISGTPTVAGIHMFSVTASAEGFDPVSAIITLNIAEEEVIVLPAITFNNALLAAGKVGSAYSATVAASGAEGITFTSDNLPAGLTLNTDGSISGTPTEAGTYLFNVTASATGATSAEASIAISIAQEDEVILPIIVFEDAMMVAGEVGSVYSATLTATGATEITFASSDLPAGLTLAANGSISGTPTEAGTYLFTVTASATGAISTEASFAISIAEEDDVIILPAITFNDVKLVDGEVGTAYSATLSASGATGITFASSNLPAGLTLAANGAISGTPTTAGTYMFTVTASATGAQSTQASIVISVAEEDEVVQPAITFNDVLLEAGKVGTAYSATLSASGATDITFASSNLPAGLTLAANGAISGTPTEAGTYLFTVTASATGSASQSASVAVYFATDVEAVTGCGSALNASTFVMSLMTVMAAGVFLFLRKRH
jgi:beta-glucosidase